MRMASISRHWSKLLDELSRLLGEALEKTPMKFDERQAVPLRITAITVKRGDFRVDIPLQPESDPFDMSDIMELEEPEEWTEAALLRFAEWFGYQIEPNPDSTLGFSVTSPSGKRLGGFVARRIIDAWQANPNPAPGAAKGKKGKSSGGGSKGGGAKKAAKTPEQKEAEKAAKEAMKLEEAKAKAEEALADIDSADMELRSKGKLAAKDIQGFVDDAKAKIAQAKDAKEVRAILKEMRRNIALYKKEATKPPAPDVQLKQTKSKLKDNLPSAKTLAGTKYDESEIQGIIDKHSKLIDSASSPEEARQAVKEMRREISEYKVDKAREQADARKKKQQAKQAAKERTAAAKAAGQIDVVVPEPVTASEWADWFARRVYMTP